MYEAGPWLGAKVGACPRWGGGMVWIEDYADGIFQHGLSDRVLAFGETSHVALIALGTDHFVCVLYSVFDSCSCIVNPGLMSKFVTCFPDDCGGCSVTEVMDTGIGLHTTN